MPLASEKEATFPEGPSSLNLGIKNVCAPTTSLPGVKVKI